jgi:hypothetical protein
MPNYLSKTEIAQCLADMGLGQRVQISRILDGLAELAEEEVSEGNDFVVPNIVKVKWAYRKPKAKGDRWKAGDEVTGFGGITSVKEKDSPVVRPAVSLKAAPFGKVGKLRVSKAEMSAFLRSKSGKAVAGRLG